MNLESELILIKQAAKLLRASSTRARNSVLALLDMKLLENKAQILSANKLDLDNLDNDALFSFRDRLSLSSERIDAIRESLKQVILLPDPLGEIVESLTLENGLKTSRIRSPLGVLFMIFESRPNVAIEAFSLALKSGNAIILRGGKESKHSVQIFYRLIKESLVEAGLPAECSYGITDPDRQIVSDLLQARKYIDVVIPRGGDALIEYVVQNSKIPIIKNDRGMCHLYLHSDANIENALAIAENAKKQRPGVCNAIETILVHQDLASLFLPLLHAKLNQEEPVSWFGCARTLAILRDQPFVYPATESSFDTEYLDLKLNCRVVDSSEEAIAHIELHGSKHSEAILTEDQALAKTFQLEVDAAAVYWNASTRFTDGFELGLGGELGISTQKLHVRGPVGLKELTSIRWIMDGTGQVRK